MNSSDTNLPVGVQVGDGQIEVNLDAFEPGMVPFCIDRGDSMIYVDETCVRIECENGDIHWLWRDGKKESFLKTVTAVKIDKHLCVIHSERVELAHGYRMSWYFLPSGALHLTFDAQGRFEEANTEGLETRNDIDGTLTIIGVMHLGARNASSTNYSHKT